MALDFPNSPAANQVFPASPLTGVSSWMWDGSAWTIPPLIPKVVTLNATGSKLYQGTLATSLNYTGLTIAAGTNLGMVVAVDWDSGAAPTGLSLTWDSGGSNQAMTRIINNGLVELWGLVNPVVGNKTLALAWTTATRVFVAGMAFNGVDQAGGATSFPNSVSSGSATTLTVTSAIGRMVMCCGTTGTAIGTITGTTIFSDAVSGSFVNAFANYDNGAASVVIGNGTGSGPRVATDIKAG